MSQLVNLSAFLVLAFLPLENRDQRRTKNGIKQPPTVLEDFDADGSPS